MQLVRHVAAGDLFEMTQRQSQRPRDRPEQIEAAGHAGQQAQRDRNCGSGQQERVPVLSCSVARLALLAAKLVERRGGLR